MRELGAWADATRAREWDATKAALLLLPLLGSNEAVPARAWAGAVLFGVGFFSAAYLLNDLSDRSCDLAAGKPRSVHRWSGRGAWLFTVAHLVISSFGAALLPVRSAPLFACGLALSWGSAIAYSFPPCRLKERGVSGLLTAAAGQRVFPMLVVAGAASAPTGELTLVLLLALLQGLRWILIHQVLDEGADRRAGVETWTTRHSGARARTLLLVGVVPAEGLTAFLLLGALAARAPGVAGLAAAWVLALPAWYRLLRSRGETVDWASYRRAPGANFLLVVLPLALLGARPDVLGALALLLLSCRYLAWQARDVVAAVTPRRASA